MSETCQKDAEKVGGVLETPAPSVTVVTSKLTMTQAGKCGKVSIE